MPKFRKVTLLEEDLKRGELYIDILGFVYLYLGKTPEGNFHFFKCCRLNLFEYFLFYNFIFIIVKGYSKIIHWNIPFSIFWYSFKIYSAL